MNTHGNTHLVEYTGDSFRDLTRIAKINEHLWTELFLLNKENLLHEITAFQNELAHFKEVLSQEDTEEMKRLFVQSTKRRKYFDRKDTL
ncbi:MAG: prephenate dehydrogenase/arogenate dehydrogenase family protein, partial [Erysipelotrichaceae bacterium]|nr:prephenate dehydrogenase/arogenate dehydrogenase family protein [Erysipelotrichaceae bacterium]